MNRLLSLTILAAGSSAVVAQSAERPNFTLFLADDCTYLDLGCYGSKDSMTPNIDKFAKQGVQFSEAYEAAPMSSPTRHNLYTGLWPVRSGAYPNHTMAYDGTLSIVQHLRPLGYKVALIGKSHVSPKSVFDFDLYVPLTKSNDLDFDAIEQFVAECKSSNTPYCLLVASNQPHTPWTKGDPSLFDQAKITIPPISVDCPETRAEYVKYLAEINYMDGEFGRVLDILDSYDQAKNSVVVYLSEQGNSLPLAKWTCYDMGVHSACLIRWPGVIKPNSRSKAIVEYVDIVPTFVDIAGGKPIAEVDGRSFKEVLEGKRKSHKEYTFSLQTSRGVNNGPEHYGIRAVYDGEYRYIMNLTPEATFKNIFTKRDPLYKVWQELAKHDEDAKFIINKFKHRPSVELYNTQKDPYCLNNLADNPKYSDKVEHLDKVLREWMSSCGDEGQATEMRAYERMPSKQK